MQRDRKLDRNPPSIVSHNLLRSIKYIRYVQYGLVTIVDNCVNLLTIFYLTETLELNIDFCVITHQNVYYILFSYFSQLFLNRFGVLNVKKHCIFVIRLDSHQCV